MEVSGQLCSRRKNPRYAFDRTLGGPGTGQEAVRKRKIIPASAGNQIPVFQPVA